MSRDAIPQPWRGFLSELDTLLAKDPFFVERVELHCVGGFVVATCYDLKRTTVDLDVFAVVPSAYLTPLLETAGKGTDLAIAHHVYIDVGSRIATVPQHYRNRLKELFADAFEHLRLLVFDPYDLALSKLERNIDRDREDVRRLARNASFSVDELRHRYESELRPFLKGRTSWLDGTLEMWSEMIEEQRADRA